jgi:hypothetical protein
LRATLFLAVFFGAERLGVALDAPVEVVFLAEDLRAAGFLAGLMGAER